MTACTNAAPEASVPQISVTKPQSEQTQTSYETTSAETTSDSASDTTSGTTAQTTEQSQSQTQAQSTSVNILTGLPAASKEAASHRPVAVMVNNVEKSLPQYGISAADIIFETLVEGGITRLMAVYPDYASVPDVCSVRSCRYYFPEIAAGLDAIYVHWGTDTTIALDTLNSIGIDRLDGGSKGSSAFGRDPNRTGKYATEHTGYLSGERLKSAVSSLGYRTKLNSSSTVMNFGAAQTSGSSAVNVSLPFSSSYFSDFTYDSSTGTYLKSHNGAPHTDSKSGSRLAFTNVFVLSTDISRMGDGSPLMKIDLDSGTGYYITKGKAQKITWSRKSSTSPFVFNSADGNPLTVNPGKSYLGIIDYASAVKFS